MTHRSQHAPLNPGHGIKLHPPVFARIVSLLLCATTTAVLVILPGADGQEDALLVQAIMPIVFLGIAAGLAHGVGIVPRNAILARMISPIVAWPLMLSALAFLALRSA